MSQTNVRFEYEILEEPVYVQGKVVYDMPALLAWACAIFENPFVKTGTMIGASLGVMLGLSAHFVVQLTSPTEPPPSCQEEIYYGEELLAAGHSADALTEILLQLEPSLATPEIYNILEDGKVSNEKVRATLETLNRTCAGEADTS